MGAKALLEKLTWDSEHFGCRIARVVPSRLTAEMGRQILAEAEKDGIDCLYFLSTANDQETVRVAEQLGFHFVDIRLTMEARVEVRSLPALQPPRGFSLRSAVETDLPALRALSRNAFRDSRFYQDPQFPDALCDRFYEQWVENSIGGGAELVLVAVASADPVGYLTCHLREEHVGKMELLVVAPEARGRGLGQALFAAALDWFAEAGVKRVVTVTQGRNLKAQRALIRAGYLPSTVQLWYHRWRPIGKTSALGCLSHGTMEPS